MTEINKQHFVSNDLARNYGIDLLRIVSMLMIVVLHILSHGGMKDAVGLKPANEWLIYFLETAVFCAVNCYALISGYVGLFSNYKYSNLIVLWCRVLFYSAPIAAACKLLFPAEVGVKDLISAFLPVLSGQYWYFSAYFILFLFIPVLNAALQTLSKKRMGAVLLALVFILSVTYPVARLLLSDTFMLGEGYTAWWLMVLYLIGGYVRKYGLFKNAKPSVLFLSYLFSVTVTWMSKWVITAVTEGLFGVIKSTELLKSYISVTVLASAIFLFLLFEKIRVGKGWVKIISFLSPLAFSVYLIHDNRFIRAHLMKGRFEWLAHLPWYQMVLLVLAFAVGIYLVCSCVDLVRHYLFKWIKLKERLEKQESRFKLSLREKP